MSWINTFPDLVFPELNPEVQEILQASNWDSDLDTRQNLAAFLDAIAKRLDSISIVSRRGYIEAIARNLYSAPPTPTLADAREAARQLGGPAAEVVHQFLNTLEPK